METLNIRLEPVSETYRLRGQCELEMFGGAGPEAFWFEGDGGEP